MKRILVITTGGTIAMRADAKAGGAVPSLVAADFVYMLPSGLADVQVEEFSNLPSAHFSVEQLWALSRQVNDRLADNAIDGAVVTHGTDTLEESAYLCDLTVDSAKPIVFTGAMRTVSEIGYEGLANLSAAIRVAASDDARELGTMIVVNDEIHAARDVTKTNTTGVGTFQSPFWGPIGFLDFGGVVIARKPLLRDSIPARQLEPSVLLLKLTAGMGPELLALAVKAGARGVVLEALGGGRVPPTWLASMEPVIAGGVPIVITSRVGTGRPVDRYGYVGAHRDLVRIGCWFAGGLSGQKARIKLMAALGTDVAYSFFEHD